MVARGKQVITDFTHGSPATRERSNDMSNPPCVRVRICNRERQSNRLHQRHIRNVVADTRARRGRDFQPRAHLFERHELVLPPLEHMSDAELTTASSHHPGATPRDDRHPDTGLGELLDPVAVAYVEDLERFTARAEVQPTIGEDAIDIQHEQLNDRG